MNSLTFFTVDWTSLIVTGVFVYTVCQWSYYQLNKVLLSSRKENSLLVLENTNLTTEVTSLIEEKIILNKKSSSLIAKLTSVTESYHTTKEDLDQLEKDFEVEKSVHRNEIRGIHFEHSEEITELKDENERLQTDVTLLNDENERLQTETILLKDENHKLQVEITILKDENNQQVISELQDENNSLQVKIAKLKNKIKSLRLVKFEEETVNHEPDDKNDDSDFIPDTTDDQDDSDEKYDNHSSDSDYEPEVAADSFPLNWRAFFISKGIEGNLKKSDSRYPAIKKEWEKIKAARKFQKKELKEENEISDKENNHGVIKSYVTNFNKPYIYLTGKTIDYKDNIKKAGGKWWKSVKAWVFPFKDEEKVDELLRSLFV